MTQNVVQEARSWLGTPFILHGWIKSVGCDCLGLIISIAKELKLRDKYNQPIVKLDTLGYQLLSLDNRLKTKLDHHLLASPKLLIGNLGLFNHFRVVFPVACDV